MITLRQLRYLSALAQHSHFGRAAEDCAVSQPALSMQIRDLENLLGVTLVERRPGDVVLTAIGQEIARRGADVLAASRDLMDFAKHSGQVLAGPLTLGVIPSLAPYILPKLLPALQRDYPDLQLALRETQTRPLIDEVKSGALDATMLALPVSDAAIATLPLFQDTFLLAVPANDPRNASVRVDAQDIDTGRLILLEDGHCLRDQALAFCATATGRTYETGRATFGASSLSTVMQMVASGYGITLLPQIAAEVEQRDARVKLLRLRDPQPGRQIGLAYRKTSPRAADFAALGDVVKGCVQHNK